MLALLYRGLGPTKRELRDEIAELDATIHEKNKEIARLTRRAYDGDALLCQEIDKLNDENDQINHERTTLRFENERLRKERDLERTVLAERVKEARASALRIEGLVKENEDLRIERDTARALAAQWEERVNSQDTYTKLLADEKERLRQRVVNLGEELDAVVATSSETIGELKEQIEEGKALMNEGIEHVDRLVAENERLQRKIRSLHEECECDSRRLACWAEDIRELQAMSDNLYVALSDLIRIDSLSRELNANDVEDYARIVQANRDIKAALAQANHYLSLYAPKEEVSV